jgi:hypothetical protein
MSEAKELTETTWFKTGGFRQTIEPVCVVKETGKTVTVRSESWSIGDGPKRFVDRRADKRGTYECYFPTWEEAHAHALSRAEANLLSARKALQNAQDKFGNVKGLKKPEAA